MSRVNRRSAGVAALGVSVICGLFAGSGVASGHAVKERASHATKKRAIKGKTRSASRKPYATAAGRKVG